MRTTKILTERIKGVKNEGAGLKTEKEKVKGWCYKVCQCMTGFGGKAGKKKLYSAKLTNLGYQE